MCLGLPCQVVEIVAADAAVVRSDSGGVRRVSIAMLHDESVTTGDWVLVHLGFAMAKIDGEHAAETQAFLDELGMQA
jgi:hydrogenase expression/formation protein HypC